MRHIFEWGSAEGASGSQTAFSPSSYRDVDETIRLLGDDELIAELGRVVSYRTVDMVIVASKIQDELDRRKPISERDVGQLRELLAIYRSNEPLYAGLVGEILAILSRLCHH